MAAFLVWFNNNWFILLQSIGIIGSLLFAGFTIRLEAKARKLSDLLALTEQHRELWKEVRERPDLARISRAEVDLLAHPITEQEEEFLNMVIVHFNTGWLLAREGSLVTLEVMAKDAATFFNLPIPGAVWRQTRQNRDPQFRSFIESCLDAKGMNGGKRG